MKGLLLQQDGTYLEPGACARTLLAAPGYTFWNDKHVAVCARPKHHGGHHCSKVVKTHSGAGCVAWSNKQELVPGNWSEN